VTPKTEPTSQIMRFDAPSPPLIFSMVIVKKRSFWWNSHCVLPGGQMYAHAYYIFAECAEHRNIQTTNTW